MVFTLVLGRIHYLQAENFLKQDEARSHAPTPHTDAAVLHDAASDSGSGRGPYVSPPSLPDEHRPPGIERMESGDSSSRIRNSISSSAQSVSEDVPSGRESPNSRIRALVGVRELASRPRPPARPPPVAGADAACRRAYARRRDEPLPACRRMSARALRRRWWGVARRRSGSRMLTYRAPCARAGQDPFSSMSPEPAEEAAPAPVPVRKATLPGASAAAAGPSAAVVLAVSARRAACGRVSR